MGVCLHQAAAAAAIVVPRWAHESSVPVVIICPQSLVTVREDHSLETSTETAQCNDNNKKGPLKSTKTKTSHVGCKVSRETRALEPGGTRTKLKVGKRGT